MLTLKKYCDRRNIEFSDYDNDLNKNPVIGVQTLYAAAIDVGSKGQRILSEYEIDDLIESMEKQDLVDIYNCYADSLESMVTKMLEEGDSKKK